MASHKDILDRQKEVSDKISSQARTLAVSILAISWFLLMPGKDGLVLPYLLNRALVIAAGTFSFLALAFDFFHYVFSYRTVQETLNSPLGAAPEPKGGSKETSLSYQYDYKSGNYKAQNFFFKYKQVALVVSAVALVFAIVGSIFGGALDLERAAVISFEEPSRLALDVAAIRQHIEELARNTSTLSPVDTSGVAGEALVLPVEVKLEGPPLTAIVSVFIVLVGSGVFLLRTSSTTGKAIGASLIAFSTLSAGGFALVKDLKIENLVQVDVKKLFEYTRVAVRQSEIPGPERIVSIEGFLVGDESRFLSPNGVEQVLNSVKIVEAVDELKRRQSSGHQVVLLVIGATDRLPIRGAKNQQFEANAGLARARAEATKHALLDRCRQSTPCSLSDDQIISLISGPKNTPVNSEPLNPTLTTVGFAEDRRVDVWALWTRKSEGR
jgi:hypothetical protein